MSGIIDISKLHTPPEKHELETARFFADLGHDVIFLNPSNIPNVHTPDIRMDGLDWEIKAPKGKSRRTIENNFRAANKQSTNIIFDLRRSGLSERECISHIKKEFAVRPKVKRVLIIKRNGRMEQLPEDRA